jgi:hypothetical protein
MSVNRTRISNVKLAVALLLGIAGVGLGPVAHIMFNSRVRIPDAQCKLLRYDVAERVGLVFDPALTHHVHPTCCGDVGGAASHRWMATAICRRTCPCVAPMSTQDRVMQALTARLASSRGRSMAGDGPL